jgi:hypothetical protein
MTAINGSADGHQTIDKGDGKLPHPQPPFLSMLGMAAHIYGIQSYVTPLLWVRDWAEYLYPPEGGPNIVKAYECRPYLPVR